MRRELNQSQRIIIQDPIELIKFPYILTMIANTSYDDRKNISKGGSCTLLDFYTSAC